MPDIAGDVSLQSPEHAAACQQVRNGPGRLHVCPPCGIKFPNAKHLAEHAGHPKHAAQAAWLAGARPAAILAAARGAAVARAAAAAGKADAKREADQKQLAAHPAAAQQPPAAAAAALPSELQQPAALQLPSLSTSAVAEGALPGATTAPSSQAADSAAKPSAEAARPALAATVQGCRICAMPGELPVSHFVVSPRASGQQCVNDGTAGLPCCACCSLSGGPPIACLHSSSSFRWRRRLCWSPILCSVTKHHSDSAGHAAHPQLRRC